MHMVMFTSVEGKKGYHQSEELDDALRFVERLRNNEGVTDAQVFRMEEVPFEVKQYYKVEVVNPTGAALAAPVGAGGMSPVSEPLHQLVEVPLEHSSDPMASVAPMTPLAPMPESAPADGRPTFSIFSKS